MVYWINFTLSPCNLIWLLIHRILSDCIPIKGRKRSPYLVIATVLSLVPWLVLGLNSSLRDSTWHLMVLLTAQNLGSAMADVVVDAMIAEAVRFERYVLYHRFLILIFCRQTSYWIVFQPIDVLVIQNMEQQINNNAETKRCTEH